MYLDDPLLQHDEAVVRLARHQEQQRLGPRRPEPADRSMVLFDDEKKQVWWSKCSMSLSSQVRISARDLPKVWSEGRQIAL